MLLDTVGVGNNCLEFAVKSTPSFTFDELIAHCTGISACSKRVTNPYAIKLKPPVPLFLPCRTLSIGIINVPGSKFSKEIDTLFSLLIFPGDTASL